METAAPGLEGKLPLVSAPAPPPPPSDAHVQHLQQGVFAPHQRAQLPTLAAQRWAGAASQAQTIQASAQVSSRVQSITVSQSPVSSAFPRPRPASRVSQALRFPPQLPLQTGRTTATTDQLRQRYKKTSVKLFIVWHICLLGFGVSVCGQLRSHCVCHCLVFYDRHRRHRSQLDLHGGCKVATASRTCDYTAS